MKTIALTCAAALIALPAFAQSGTTNTNNANGAASGNAAGSSAPLPNGTTQTPTTAPAGTTEMPNANNKATVTTPSTKDFVKKAASSDMFEIQSSQLLTNSKVTDTSTKNFATKMIEDHRQTSKQLKQLVKSGKVKADIPTSMSSKQQKMLSKLKGLSGKALVRQYREDQVAAHQKAVDMFQSYANNGENSDLKNWASDTVSTLKQHLQMARQLTNGK